MVTCSDSRGCDVSLGRVTRRFTLEKCKAVSSTTYAYDLNGNLRKVTDPRNNVTAYEYDAMNRKVFRALPDPDGTAPLVTLDTTWDYTSDGLLEQVTDPLNQTTSYATFVVPREQKQRDWRILPG